MERQTISVTSMRKQWKQYREELVQKPAVLDIGSPHTNGQDSIMLIARKHFPLIAQSISPLLNAHRILETLQLPDALIKFYPQLDATHTPAELKTEFIKYRQQTINALNNKITLLQATLVAIFDTEHDLDKTQQKALVTELEKPTQLDHIIDELLSLNQTPHTQKPVAPKDYDITKLIELKNILDTLLQDAAEFYHTADYDEYHIALADHILKNTNELDSLLRT